MSTSYERRANLALAWLIGINVGVFIIQHLEYAAGFRFVEQLLGLGVAGLEKGFVWNIATYSFLHSRTNPGHILFNMILLYFLAKPLLQVMTLPRFFQLYIASVILGGLLWLGTDVWITEGRGFLVGASAGVYSLLIFFTCLHPNRELQFLLIPIRIKTKVIAYVAVGSSLIFFLAQELPGKGGVAHSAHLGGMLAGWLFFQFVYSRNIEFGQGMRFQAPKWLQKRKRALPTNSENYNYKVNVSQPRDMKKEVDRILDKINSKGFGALSAEEKQTLDDAKDLLSRR